MQLYNPQSAKLKFGQWLIGQIGRDDAIGALAKAAKADPHFPSNGNYEAVSRRLHQQEADIEMHEALDDAELEWLTQ